MQIHGDASDFDKFVSEIDVHDTEYNELVIKTSLCDFGIKMFEACLNKKSHSWAHTMKN